MLNYKEQMKFIEHGKRLREKQLVNEMELIFKRLEQRKGIGPKTMAVIYEEFGVEFK